MIKNLPANAGDKRCRLDPWVRKILWGWAQQPIPIFLPGESHGQRSPAGCSPAGLKESDTSDLARRHDALKKFLRHHYIKGKQSCSLFRTIVFRLQTTWDPAPAQPCLIPTPLPAHSMTWANLLTSLYQDFSLIKMMAVVQPASQDCSKNRVCTNSGWWLHEALSAPMQMEATENGRGSEGVEVCPAPHQRAVTRQGEEGPAAADGGNVTDDHSHDDDPCHLWVQPLYTGWAATR